VTVILSFPAVTIRYGLGLNAADDSRPYYAPLVHQPSHRYPTVIVLAFRSRIERSPPIATFDLESQSLSRNGPVRTTCSLNVLSDRTPKREHAAFVPGRHVTNLGQFERSDGVVMTSINHDGQLQSVCGNKISPSKLRATMSSSDVVRGRLCHC
jgi:hypothetical protein